MAQFKLIDGEFPLAEARELILALLEYKINFHSRESFRSEIRKGQKDDRSLKRKQELQVTRESFLKMVSGLDPETTVRVTADINVS